MLVEPTLANRIAAGLVVNRNFIDDQPVTLVKRVGEDLRLICEFYKKPDDPSSAQLDWLVNENRAQPPARVR